MGKKGINIATPFDRDAEKALELMLKVLGKSDKKDEISNQIRKSYTNGSSYVPEYLNPLKFVRRGLTLFEFNGLGNVLGLITISDIFIVQTNSSATGFDKLHNFVERKYKSRYDMFEFGGDDDCLIAFD